MPYRAPVRDLLFSLTAVADLKFTAEIDRETCQAILEAAGSIAEEVLAPLNKVGDAHGAKLTNGQVTTTPGFKEAYKAYVEGGWIGLSCSPEYGGQDLPKAIDAAVFEIMSGANMAFALCPMLTAGAIEALTAHGSEALKARYLPKMVAGEWTGTMLLTEPHAGSDLGRLTTRAEPDGDAYKLYGQKIFITWGDHDVADNIVQLVLARLPDAPDGARGISLFVTSKRTVHDNGELGDVEPVLPVGLEHKLGIHGSPTCTMSLEGAKAWLVGEPNQGLAHMFTMMNAARLKVGIEGVAVAEAAYQHALEASLERRQGRSAWTGDANAPIFDHPDVRRSLAVMKAKIEAARAMCLSTAVASDIASSNADPAARAKANAKVQLLTPITKAWSTDIGVEVASMALQIHGGMGFIEETGASQFYRDARIAPIYEGTNGIQAIDLVGRKLTANQGQAFKDLISEAQETAQSGSLIPSLSKASEALGSAVASLKFCGEWLMTRKGDPAALCGATSFLNLAGDVIGGMYLLKAATAASELGDHDHSTRASALFDIYVGHVLATATGRAETIMRGDETLLTLSKDALSSR